MQISIQINGLEEVKRGLLAMQKEIPYAIARSLSKTAVEVKTGEYDHMRQVFDRPTPYTMSSLYTKPATMDNLESWVWVKEKSDRQLGTPATHFLAPQIFGGERNFKRHEVALRNIGVLPNGAYCVPAKGAKIDAYGNMSPGQIVQIMSYFQAFSEEGSSKNITEKKKARMAKGTKKTPGQIYFAIRKRRGKLAPGIYMRTSLVTGAEVKMLIAFVKKPMYSKRFMFWEIAEKVANEKWKPLFDEAMEVALAKAR